MCVCVCVELNKFDSLRGARALPPGTITRSSWPIGVEYLHSNALVRRGRTRSYLRVRQAARERVEAPPQRKWVRNITHFDARAKREKLAPVSERLTLREIRFQTKQTSPEHTLSSVKLPKREYRE